SRRTAARSSSTTATPWWTEPPRTTRPRSPRLWCAPRSAASGSGTARKWRSTCSSLLSLHRGAELTTVDDAYATKTLRSKGNGVTQQPDRHHRDTGQVHRDDRVPSGGAAR